MAKQKKAPSKRTRNERRQPTPPPIIQSELKKDESGVSRVNKEIATLIARKDPLLNQVSKKSKTQITRGKKGRVAAKMEKAAAKADQLAEKTAKSQQRGKEIKKRRLNWEVINEKKAGSTKENDNVEEMVIE